MWKTIKKYNWKHLASDLVVVMMSAGLTFLVNWLASLDLGSSAPETAGGLGFILNRVRHAFV